MTPELCSRQMIRLVGYVEGVWGEAEYPYKGYVDRLLDPVISSSKKYEARLRVWVIRNGSCRSAMDIGLSIEGHMYLTNSGIPRFFGYEGSGIWI